MLPTKEWNLRMSGTSETSRQIRRNISLGTLSPAPWDYRIDANPSEQILLGLSLH
jgi:hypothetical protein